MKEKLFEVLAGLISCSEFETWIYNDAEIQCSILEDDNVFRLCSIDFSSKYVLHELNKFCFDVYDEEEFYIYAIEANARFIIGEEDSSEVVRYVRNICVYSDCGDDKHFFCQFYWLKDAYDEVEYSGYSSRLQIIQEIKSLAQEILNVFENASLSEKKKLLFSDLTQDQLLPQSIDAKPQNRWYQFWK